VIEEALNHLSGLILVDLHDDHAYGLSSAARPMRMANPLYNHSAPRARVSSGIGTRLELC
jgi:hypothetical protein